MVKLKTIGIFLNSFDKHLFELTTYVISYNYVLLNSTGCVR